MATIEKNIFLKNGTYHNTLIPETRPSGGALYNCDGLIQNNKFQDNQALYGGALAGCDGIIQNNLFINNHAYDSQELVITSWNPKTGPQYGYIPVDGDGSALLTDNAIIRNNTIVTDDLHTIIVANNAAIIINNIMWNSSNL